MHCLGLLVLNQILLLLNLADIYTESTTFVHPLSPGNQLFFPAHQISPDLHQSSVYATEINLQLCTVMYAMIPVTVQAEHAL